MTSKPWKKFTNYCIEASYISTSVNPDDVNDTSTNQSTKYDFRGHLTIQVGKYLFALN